MDSNIEFILFFVKKYFVSTCFHHFVQHLTGKQTALHIVFLIGASLTVFLIVPRRWESPLTVWQNHHFKSVLAADVIILI
ncbi:hypothetical protein BTW01_06215 [Bacillus sp. SKDU12]|nr:hypothetical protein BTW01_06215 [Bacillus sp. SKDU12]